MTNTSSSRTARWLLENSTQHSQNRIFDKDFLLLPDGQRVKDLQLSDTDVDGYCLQRFGISFAELVNSARVEFERGTDSAVELLGRVMSAIRFGEPPILYEDVLVGIERDLLSYALQDYSDAKMQLGLLYCSMGKYFGHSEDEGLSWLHKAFKSGHSDAPSELGTCYLRREKWDKAASYLRKGDRQKCARCAFRLAEMHHQGAGSIKRDLQKAFKLYGQASMRGYPEATVEMVELFLTDPCAFKLPATPDELLRESIADGHPKAMYWLADMFEYGLHLPVNFREALALYEQAANLGLAAAQLKMGNIYDETHRGDFPVQQNEALAVHWYGLAANNPEISEVRKRAHEALGDIAMRAQRFEQAGRCYLNAVELGSVTAAHLAAMAACYCDDEQCAKGGK